MSWQPRTLANASALGHNKVLRMKAKMNRYDLSLWDVRKLSLYGRALESPKLQLLAVASLGKAWLTLPQPRPNKTAPSRPCRKAFLKIGCLYLPIPSVV